MLIVAIPPTVLFILLAGLRLVAEALYLPRPIPRLFSVSLAVILSSVYVGLIAHRRGVDRAWGVVPTMVIISLVAQVVIVSMQGVLASVLGTPSQFNGLTDRPEGQHILLHLLFIGLFMGLLLSIPALIIHLIVRRDDQAGGQRHKS